MTASALSLPTPFPLHQRWRHALPALIVLLGWILFLYRDTAAAMVSIWARSETFTHGFLVPPIVLWLIWRQRKALAAQTPHATPKALLIIGCAASAWFLGELAAVNAVTQLALVTLLVGSVLSLLGRPVVRLIMFPLGFLFFAVPVGEFLLPYFMEWTANFTVFALRLSGIPVYREGLNFIIPSGSWSVVEACSGVRYLIASLMVGTLFSYLNYQSTKRRVIFILVSIAVPVVANWMRAYMIVMLGHISDNKLAAGVDHLIYGWLFFGIVIMLMFIVGSRWAEPEKIAVPDVYIPQDATLLAAPEKIWLTAAFLAVLVALPHMALWFTDRGVRTEVAQLTAPLQLTPHWSPQPTEATDFKPAFQNPSAQTNTVYTDGKHAVGLYVGYYSQQTYGHKLVSSDNVLVTSLDPRWSRLATGSASVTLLDKQLSVRATELRSTGFAVAGKERHLVAWQLYWINGSTTSNDYLAKAYGAYYRLMGRSDDAAVIVAYAYQEPGSNVNTVLASFLSSNYTFINNALLKARQNR